MIPMASVGPSVPPHSSAGHCPYLGSVNARDEPDLPVEYPSFENRCLAAGPGESILLTDQATFCLSGGHRYCPRFRRAAPAEATGVAGEPFAPAGDDLADPLADADLFPDPEAEPEGRPWTWLGAALIFAVSLLCGGAFAAYVGWQLVNSNLLAGELFRLPSEPGRVDTLASGPVQALPQIYLVVTATGEPPANPAASPLPPVPPTLGQGGNVPGDPGPAFPPAVTPTPTLDPALAAPTGSPTPLVDVQLPVPTRRPTPIVVIAFDTPTPGDLPSPTPSPTATPVLGPPVVHFAPEETELPPGKCTYVTWDVENVRAVYYENLGVDGHGRKEECIKDRDGHYNLMVVFPDGSSRVYTATVRLLPPTPTPTDTPTFTPEPQLTPTWTPTVPTATPTPVIRYGVALAVDDGTRHTCDTGSACQIGVLVTNTGDTMDNLVALLMRPGPWPSRFCRLDGVCAGDRLVLVNVGPGNTAYIHFVVDVPADAGTQTVTFELRAESEGSQGSAVTEVQAVEISTQP